MRKNILDFPIGMFYNRIEVMSGMKRLLPLILALCFSLCDCQSGKANSAEDFEYSFFEYSESEYATIKGYIGESKTVVIPATIEGKPVLTISSAAFAKNKDMERVVIPDTVTVIWDYAFANCESLKQVTFGDNMTSIGSNAFSGCTSLKKVQLPEKLEQLAARAFYNCTALKTVSLNKNLSRMGMEAFYGCPIEKLTLEDGIQTFGSYASFWSATLTELTIPASVETIGESSFEDTLKKVTFQGDAPKTVGKQPFGTKAVLYYKKGTAGWDTSPLQDEYKTIAR